MAVKKKVVVKKSGNKKPFMPPWMAEEMPMSGEIGATKIGKPVISTKAMKSKAKTKKGKAK